MKNSQLKQYWNTWLWRDAMTRIITVNFLIWLMLWAFLTFTPFGGQVTGWLVLPALPIYLMRPWTLLTYMFVQTDFMHLLANMLWLMLFGRLYEMMRGGARLTALYIYGGLAGGIVFVLLGLLPVGTHYWMLGSSCSVLAVVGAVWLMQPDWEVNLLMFGSLKIKWISLAAVIFLVVLSTSWDAMAAHGAGLLVGVLSVIAQQHGVDMLKPAMGLWKWMQSIGPKPTARPVNPPRTRMTREQELDELLKKVSRTGYNSLTAQERQRLFDLSRPR